MFDFVIDLSLGMPTVLKICALCLFVYSFDNTLYQECIFEVCVLAAVSFLMKSRAESISYTRRGKLYVGGLYVSVLGVLKRRGLGIPKTPRSGPLKSHL